MQKTIEGKVVFQPIEGGIWGIEDAAGNQWQPLNFPEQLKVPGAEVRVKIRELKDFATMQMWGAPVKILTFHTLTP